MRSTTTRPLMTERCFPNGAAQSPREPDALCNRCGTRGTIARITFSAPVSRAYRFCASCWPGLRADRDAIHALIAEERISAEAARSRNTAFFAESRFWDDVADFVDLIRISDDEEWLTEQARLIVDMARDIDGPMPSTVADFVTKYSKFR